MRATTSITTRELAKEMVPQLSRRQFTQKLIAGTLSTVLGVRTAYPTCLMAGEPSSTRVAAGDATRGVARTTNSESEANSANFSAYRHLPDEVRSGDIAFQHVPNHLSSYVAELGRSRFSNCGLVVRLGEQAWVIDTLAGVKYVPWNEWRQCGRNGEFLIARPPGLLSKDVPQVLRVASQWLGRGHDLALGMDDQKVYGTELVYKAFLRGARLQLGSRQLLLDLAWKDCEPWLRTLQGGDLLLDRQVVTPGGLLSGNKLQPILQNLVSVEDRNPLLTDHPHRAFRGTWTGQYTLDDLALGVAWVTFGPDGEFFDGAVLSPGGERLPIQRMGIVPLDAQGTFVAELVDGRGFTTRLQGRMLDEGTRLLGAWKDERGRRGMCSLARSGAVFAATTELSPTRQAD